MYRFSDERDQVKKYYEVYNIYKELSNKEDDETCIQGCEMWINSVEAEVNWIIEKTIDILWSCKLSQFVKLIVFVMSLQAALRAAFLLYIPNSRTKKSVFHYIKYKFL